MFKSGDLVQCVNNADYFDCLTINKIYKVVKYRKSDDSENFYGYSYIVVENLSTSFSVERFKKIDLEIFNTLGD